MDHEQISFLGVLRWTEDECREFLESQRWPDGPHCPKCGDPDPWKIVRRSTTKNTVRSLYRCRGCKRQYTATVGTIFEDSKIPLSKWFAAIFLMCGSKKGISAHQIHRELGITYKSAWFMCHRIREAMNDQGPAPLTGIVEADETYVTRKTTRGHKVWREFIRDEEELGIRARSDRPYRRRKNPVVFGMLERGGRARTAHVIEAKADELRPIILKNLDVISSRLMTDGHPAYRLIRQHLPHDVIDHELEYVRGDVHTQGIENYWSILKRGFIGVFHHVDERYLGRYLNEFEFRFNRRKISDADRFALLMRQVRGRVLWYCRTPQAENPYA